MKEIIQDKLEQLEKDRNIKILYAVESGSRAWGFSSKDSDYDVRFIYVPDITYYFDIRDLKDNIEVMDGDLDFAGWELRKALRLLYKGNPPLLEWLRSPLVYKVDPEAVQDIKALAEGYYDVKRAIYHYLHMAENNYRAYIKERPEVRQKKYLYILRPLLACRWIELNGSMPPMEIETTLETVKDQWVEPHIRTLIELKRSGSEMGLTLAHSDLNDYIEFQLNYYKDYVRLIPDRLATVKPLNDYLLKYTYGRSRRS